MDSSTAIEVGLTIKSRTGIYYRNVQLLGKGGNSVVYLVHALGGEYRGVLFALKLFTRLSEPERLERFYKESIFLLQCNHPSIMRIYDEGVYHSGAGSDAKAYPFVVAEFLPQTLQDMISQRLSTAERVAYTLQLLSALAYLHGRKPAVIHRDIKPQNVFIKGRSCVLGDFGLMKFSADEDEIDRQAYVDSVEPRMPFFYRTPDLVAYAKKEKPLTTQSDIFQIGLLAAQLFTGRNPEKRAKTFLDPVELEALAPIPGALCERIGELITSTLAHDPDKRPTAVELIDPWEGIFREVVGQCHQLDGRVF